MYNPIRDVRQFSATAGLFRLMGFIEYAQYWERTIEAIFDEHPELEDQLIEAQEQGLEKATKSHSNSRGVE